MFLRGALRTLLVALLLVLGGSLLSAPEGPASLSRARTECHGLSHDGVRGTDPTYTRKRLASYPNSKVVCHAIWMPNPRRFFVPQGLAITGRSAWVSGFHYRSGYGQRPCQLVRVDLLSGRRLQYHGAIYGRVGRRPTTYCRHGGGIMRRGPWLWIVEKNKLWLVDPSASGNALRARRVWRIHAPVRGSAIVSTATRIGLVPYQTRGVPRIFWYSIRSLIRRGVLDLAVRPRGRTQLGAVASTRIPRLVQGATLDSRGRLYLSRSNLSCAELVTPYGRRMALVPGAEGIEFAARGRRLWVVSESGAWPYSAVSRKPLTPVVSSFEFPRLLAARRSTCGFPAY